MENECESVNVTEVVAELRNNLDTFMGACFELTRDGPTVQIQEAVRFEMYKSLFGKL